MSKKTNQKKKVNIKLEDNQSFMIEDLSILLHIQKTYSDIMRAHCSEQDRATCARVIEAINLSVENVHIALGSDQSEKW